MTDSAPEGQNMDTPPMQNKYQIATDISFLASRILLKYGNAYCELFEYPNGATIKTIFFNGGRMKIKITYTPN